MTGWRLRDFHSDDLDGILRLWEEIKASDTEPVYGLSEVLASCQKDHAVVAVHGDESPRATLELVEQRRLDPVAGVQHHVGRVDRVPHRARQRPRAVPTAASARRSEA